MARSWEVDSEERKKDLDMMILSVVRAGRVGSLKPFIRRVKFVPWSRLLRSLAVFVKCVDEGGVRRQFPD